MKTVDLNKVLEMLINEEQSEASSLLHEWFVEKTRQVHEELMQEDDSLSGDIEDDQEAIESEEFYSESEDESDDMDDMEDMEDESHDDDDDDDDHESAEETIADTIEDLEAVMARLKAEFAEITGDDDTAEDEVEEADVTTDIETTDAEMVMDSEDTEESEEVDFVESEENSEESLEEASDDDSDEITESEDDFADLEESWTLEPVKDPNLDGGKEIGSHGAKVNVNDTSPIPQKKGPDRVGGKAVEIKAKEHVGFDRETPPATKEKPLRKNQVKKSMDNNKTMSKEGDKSAMLNSKAGFGSDSPKSPIGGGAADLRGNDFKR